MYRGPSAWIVCLNAVFCGIAFIPLVLFGLLWLIEKTVGPGSFAMWWFLFFIGFCELSYVAIIPGLLAVCVMFASQKIPKKVKEVTGVIEFVALAQLWWLLHKALVGLHSKP
jgi:hypothetical protein